MSINISTRSAQPPAANRTFYSYSFSINQEAPNIKRQMTKYLLTMANIRPAICPRAGFIDQDQVALIRSHLLFKLYTDASSQPQQRLLLMKRDDKLPNVGKKGRERVRQTLRTPVASPALIKTRFSRRRMKPRGVLFISVSPLNDSLSLLR